MGGGRAGVSNFFTMNPIYKKLGGGGQGGKGGWWC